jgi:hypothetical protein
VQGGAIHQHEWQAFALHLSAEPTLARPVAALPEPPDAGPERIAIETDLGIPELESSLAQFGTPPVAPPARKVDREALERDLLSAGAAGISRWKVGARRSLGNEARAQASEQAAAEDERLAAEQRQLQHDLDGQWADLRARRHRAAQETEKWVSEEMHRREAARREQQAALEAEWRAQVDATPSTVTAAMRSAFPIGTTNVPGGTTTVINGATTVLGFLNGVAVLVVACADRDSLIDDTKPTLTGGRSRPVRRTPERRPERSRNDLYLAVIASRVLAAVGRALSITPAVEAATCVAVRSSKSKARLWEPIYVGTFDREYAERLLAEGRWSPDRVALAQAVEGAGDVELERTGTELEITALDMSEDPGLRAVIDQMDPAISSDGIATRASDQEAVSIFLTGAETADQIDQKRGEEDVAPLPRDTTAAPEPRGAATYEPTEMAARNVPSTKREEAPLKAQAMAEEPAQEPMSSADQRNAGAVAERGDGSAPREPGGDPLPEALKDSDGYVRRAAVEAIGKRNDPDDTPLLLQTMSDEDEIVRLEAMYALKDRLSPDMRRDALLKACGDRDESVRLKAIEALAHLADERDTPVLLQALKDPDQSVRLEAVYAIKYRLAPDMRNALIDACRDANESVRRRAIGALAELGDERDTPLLLETLRDSDPSVRLEAIYALEGRSALGPSSRISEPLLEAMKAEDAIVRQAAVRLFGRL